MRPGVHGDGANKKNKLCFNDFLLPKNIKPYNKKTQLDLCSTYCKEKIINTTDLLFSFTYGHKNQNSISKKNGLGPVVEFNEIAVGRKLSVITPKADWNKRSRLQEISLTTFKRKQGLIFNEWLILKSLYPLNAAWQSVFIFGKRRLPLHSGRNTGFGESTVKVIVNDVCKSLIKRLWAESVSLFFRKTNEQFEEKILNTEQLSQFPCC